MPKFIMQEKIRERRKYFIFILTLFVCTEVISQSSELRITPTIESEIIYKDGTREKGLLWLASSAFHPRLKEGKKNRKIDYNKIEKIITNPESDNKRIFQYLQHNYNKFRIFVELVYSDEISIYMASKGNTTDLFYSDFDRTTIRERLLNFKQESNLHHQITSNTIELPDGGKISMPIGYSHFNNLSFGSSIGHSPEFQHYILKEGVSKLMKVEKNKRFLKKSREFFKNCPSIIIDLEEKKITLDHLPTFIEYYKTKCRQQEKE